MTSRMKSRAVTAILVLGVGVAAEVLAEQRAVLVNGVALSANTVMALERMYRVPVQNGRYWYDPRSGVWGFEGGPALGQMQPGLALGGPLHADASHGTTGVFVNGRQLHLLDVLALQRCTVVVRGRYWVDARGIGGYEGGPALFSLAQLCARVSGGGGGSGSSTQTECFSNGCQSTNSRTGIGAITDGQGHGAVFIPGGGMVMTPN